MLPHCTVASRMCMSCNLRRRPMRSPHCIFCPIAKQAYQQRKLEFDCYRKAGHGSSAIDLLSDWPLSGGLQMTTGRMLRHLSLGFLLVLSVCGVVGDTNAQSSNVIRIVVAGGPGTPPDVISRVIAGELSESDGWRVTV